ncbi:glycoside hydrolase family 10 protein [Brasilonema octagenarum UFV-E1]|uniref:Glycoside hydrolase family 10 protein n=1 Tax=Brasilonema sennae CENA114 TaxID=415709 RepID=A0A856MK32_9CYAN|nr:glycoside hydrolase family 10 protein [Brasilonema sennae]QDL10504.1 glycoside hydrolase family 10 protein [Brasilonema sennae CENA114]QDL16850.1 glycoside hydrolase family 10 protein [Brasilonema octagenarum UFV-E1]
MMKKLVKWCHRLLSQESLAIKKQSFFVLLVSLSMVGAILLSFPLYAQNTPLRPQTSELRGVWLTNIDSNVLFARDRLQNSLQTLKNLNFNTVYPTVWNWGWTLYPSKVAQKVTGRSLDPAPGLQGRDILKEIVTLGHQKNLTVIPWFEFGFMAPADSQLAKNRPQWLTSRRDGSKIWKEGAENRVWLNPFHPEVQQFIQDLVVEIVKNYDIDGIQFDDHFGLPYDLGYDAYTVALYKKEHRGKAPSTNSQDAEWVRWRANKITDYMKRVFQAIKATKKNCLVSVSPNPQEFSYKSFLADWQTWERLGLIEELIIQIYRDDLNVFVQELERPEVKAAQSHIPVSIGIMTGLKAKPVSMQQIQTQIQKVRERNFAGVSFFFYETLWNMTGETPQQRQASFQKIFPTSVAYPSLLAGWKP